jgi:hypothetical protein
MHKKIFRAAGTQKLALALTAQQGKTANQGGTVPPSAKQTSMSLGSLFQGREYASAGKVALRAAFLRIAGPNDCD